MREMYKRVYKKRTLYIDMHKAVTLFITKIISTVDRYFLNTNLRTLENIPLVNVRIKNIHA